VESTSTYRFAAVNLNGRVKDEVHVIVDGSQTA